MAVKKELNIRSISGKIGPSMAKVTQCRLRPLNCEFLQLCLAGLWYYLAGEPLPSLTLIGSSNYGRYTPHKSRVSV